MTNWNDLVSGEDLHNIAKDRQKDFETTFVLNDDISSKEKSGWAIQKLNKNGTAIMKRNKKTGDSFEDEVWMLFYKMGFTTLNSTRNFKVSYSKDQPGLTKQIDVIAVDDEVCLLIECKSSVNISKVATWKNELESINGYKGNLFNELKQKFGDKKYKYILATKNFIIGDQDRTRMKDFRIANFDHDAILYFNQLVNHLGKAAKYQLLSTLFTKEKIKEMDNRVPAIEGKMGGLTYYSFSIEPSKLLKLAYVLHRNKANHQMMPTYQRLIKKERLKAVRKYIDEGNYFPNSLIVSLDTGDRSLKFERSDLQVENSISKIGVLYLPQTYQSAYVIDGQHRLYGYSESKYADNNTVPVVAFLDLDKDSQLKMFMDINENQKAVPKSLRNTLNIDLKWNSEKLAERNMAIMLDIGQRLGEERKSALFGRIVTGENSVTRDRCITLEYIRDALSKTKFFNEYKNNTVVRHGTIALGNNDDTLKNIYPMLLEYFSIIQSQCKEEWDKGSDGCLTINNMIFALIRIFDDIFNLALERSKKTSTTNWQEVFILCSSHIDSLCSTLNNMDDSVKQKIKTSKGGSAKTVSWRELQVAVNQTDDTFVNSDLMNYIEENCVDYSQDVISHLHEARELLTVKLSTVFSESKWFENFFPENLQIDLMQRRVVKAFKKDVKSDDISFWDLMSFKDYIQLIDYANNWSTKLSNVINTNSEEDKITKIKFITFLGSLQKLENKVERKLKMSKSDFDNILAVLEILQK
ncbi:MAG: DGQHR domain-containing protein [Erysipelothrix sp.]|nr:DGQHR domain-containing protein [Erysipelothrix sp.]